MARLVAGLLVMIAGPWAVWLGYAHLIRPVWQDTALEYALLATAFGVGVLGILLVRNRLGNWSRGSKITAAAVCLIALAISMPMIALVSICTTGDCL